jgi:hypothetical protein
MRLTGFTHGAKTVGAAAVQILATAAPLSAGVQIKASDTNTGIVYIGDTSSVTANTADATDGFPLSAGQGLFVPIDDVTRLYAIASAAGQKLFYAVL